jgi:hypothetical protein
MHNIHWAVIFSNGTTSLLLIALGLFLASSLRKASRKITKPIGNGDKVEVTLTATGETLTGTVTGVEQFPAGFKINCK